VGDHPLPPRSCRFLAVIGGIDVVEPARSPSQQPVEESADMSYQGVAIAIA